MALRAEHNLLGLVCAMPFVKAIDHLYPYRKGKLRHVLSNLQEMLSKAFHEKVTVQILFVFSVPLCLGQTADLLPSLE